MSGESRFSSLMHWLVSGAPGPENFIELTAEIGRRLESAGLPVDQFGIYTTMVHPGMPGRLDYWTPSAGSRTIELSPDQLLGDIWMGTPGQVCQKSGRMLVYVPGEAPEFDARADMQAIRARGYRQLVYLPLHSRYTPALNCVGFCTKQDGGFTPEQIVMLRRLQAPIARITEGYVLHESTIAILSTYVGRDAGARVLTGNIRRGDAETIPALVAFVDLKGFTALSNARSPADVVALLNRFFSILDDCVQRHGGEILKFIGDGALCIFPTPDDLAAQAAAAGAALAALEDAEAALSESKDGGALGFRAALTLGDVHYGNIGSANRLDFTVIGPTVNLAARLLTAAAEHGEDTVCSSEIAALLDTPTRPLGTHPVKGFSDPVMMHALDL